MSDSADTPRFSVGDFVRLRTDHTRVGVVQAGERVQVGTRRIPVRAPDGRLNYFPEAALELVPAAAESPRDLLAAGSFVAPDWLRRTLARIRVTGRLSDVVYSMEATDTDFYAHQFKPVLKLLNSPTDALLIADEVGLGKTIEAGLIWTELRARIEADRLLVVCPKTLCEKWRVELDRRFGVDARIVDATGLLELLSPDRRAARGFAAIASIQSLRPPRGWDADEDLTDGEARGPAQSPRARLARFLDEASDGDQLLDLLVVDEAHHMRNPETLLNRLGGLANAVSTYRVFLSATPIHLQNRDLNSLLRLIDPDTFEFEGTLNRIIAANAPLVAARDRVLDRSSTPAEIAELIGLARRQDLLADSKSLRLLQDLVTSRPLDTSLRAEIAGRLEMANQLASYITRTRRRDVEELRVVRRPLAPELPLEGDERVFYEAITRVVLDYAAGCAGGERFLLSMPQRLVSSSPAAAAAWWEARGAAMAAAREREPLESEDQEDEEDIGVADAEIDFKPLVAALADKTRELNLTRRLREVDTKFALLRRELERLWREEPDAKLIIFSSFKATLGYLQERLREVGVPTELMHGTVAEPRDTILRRFRDRQGRCVLLSSEVGSEGVDLQFCWIVVNYDLPWNPMRLEQRIGRVDRLGQEREQVTILNLIYADTIDDRIYRKLYERLKLGEQALGEFEAVLGEPIREMTRQLLDPRLTDAERTQAIERAEQAIKNRARQTNDLEAEAGSLMRHGDFVLSKIRESHELHRWLDGNDIHFYVRDRLKRSFAGVTIEAAPAGDDTCRIRLPDDAREALGTWLAGRGLRSSTRILDDDDRQRFRFTASVVGSRQARVENISQSHPLVRFAAHLDAGDPEGIAAQAVAARLSPAKAPDNCAPGTYLVAIRRWAATDGAGRATGLARLAYAGARHDTGERIEPELAEALGAAAAQHGTALSNLQSDDRLPSFFDLATSVVEPELDGRYGDYTGEIEVDIEDRLAVRLRALEAHLESKRQGLERRISLYRDRAAAARARGDDRTARRSERLIPAEQGKLRKLEQSCARRRDELEVQRHLTPEETDLAILLVEVGDNEARHR